MVGGIGCFVSSMLTLLVFFPRSIVQESGYTVVHPDQIPSTESTYRPPSYHLPASPRPSGSASFALSPETAYTQNPSQGNFTPYGRGMLHRKPSRPLRNARPFTLHSLPEHRQSDVDIVVNAQAYEQNRKGEKDKEKDDDEVEIVDHVSEQDAVEVHLEDGRFQFEPSTAVRLEDITYDEMQARGTRYGNILRSADAVHPYIRHFVSPLDVYDHFQTEE